ncbi:MAG TPA: amino acid permease [Dongiaceae bacterium]|nr:amino acid permease [Dongiaceae bacterium]
MAEQTTGTGEQGKVAYEGVHYENVEHEYFEKRTLRRYARVGSLWALGVGAVISGHYSGWNLGLAPGGFGGFLIAGIVIGIMYVGLCYCLAEMSPALPHTGAAYSFARSAMGPWGGYITGLAENIEYVITPAVITYFIGAYMSGIFGTPDAYQPIWWIVFYGIFLTLNLLGVELSFRVSVIVTLLALAILAVFYVSAIPHFDFNRWALNIGIGADGAPVELPEGGGEFMPFGIGGVFAALPFAVWLFLAIEQLPLAAEESHDPKKDMPKGLLLGILTLCISATLVTFLNSSIPVTDGTRSGAFYLGTSGEPILDGFRVTIPGLASVLSLLAVVGLIASLHTIIYAAGRQIYSLSRAGYIPRALSVTHGKHKVPHVALIASCTVGFLVMLVVFWWKGSDAGAIIGGTLLNMAVFGATISYGFQAISFILLRRNLPHIDRPFRSPLGVPGATLTLAIAVVTLYMQLQDPVYQYGVYGAAIWYAVGIVYFALIGRHKLVYSPEEDFAVKERQKALGHA